jgi:hypothetical protein
MIPGLKWPASVLLKLCDVLKCQKFVIPIIEEKILLDRLYPEGVVVLLT